jgi:Zn-dependent peptidase ImmA (M78 family)
MTAIPDDFEFRPLANVMRGIASDASEPANDQLIDELAERGLDVEETISQVESRISAFLQRPRVTPLRYTRAEWKHPSVQLFAEDGDPVAKMMALASDLALRGLERTVDRTSVDPFSLAELKGISVVPNEDILDARLVPLGSNRFRIEYNPIQPRARIRFSIAHELAHTFFPNCQDLIRNRGPRATFGPHEWELEMLCNIGAAELLMPVANFPMLTRDMLGIDRLLELKQSFEVSSEALMSRAARLTHEPCSMFAASRIETGDLTGRYRVDYAVPSRAWKGNKIDVLPKNTALNDCTAIGFTAKQDEAWPGLGEVHIECVGVPPYAGSGYPRIVGLIRRVGGQSLPGVRILYVKGDATQPRGAGPRVIAHVVNDKAASWGTGFARAIATKWPAAQTHFREWATRDRLTFRLGNTFQTSVAENLWAFQMVCQHGYGASPLPRIRYGALKACLDSLALFARERNATVHMPRLGSGQGHAVWSIVSELVDAALCSAGIPVTVYDLPNARQGESMELPGLFSTR